MLKGFMGYSDADRAVRERVLSAPPRIRKVIINSIANV
jgi:hypothetical protein